jgi:hypothetical protein
MYCHDDLISEEISWQLKICFQEKILQTDGVYRSELWTGFGKTGGFRGLMWQVARAPDL